MFGSQILEVAMGVIFVYLLASVICTAVREGIEAWMGARAVYLEHAIRELLQDRGGNGLAKALYTHPLIYGLYSGDYVHGQGVGPSAMTRGHNLPTYIPSRNFAVALMDIAARGPVTDAVSGDPAGPVMSLDAIRRNILNIQNPPVQRVLLMAVDSAQGDIDKVRKNLETWYDSAMDRISGEYKRLTQWILFAIALTIAVGLNINSLTLADYIYRNDAARAAIVARAEVAATNTAYVQNKYDAAKNDLAELHLPIGWAGHWRLVNPMKDGLWAFAGPLIGWLLTAFAASLGAPFWFDMLNKIMVIRSTVKPHEKSPEEASEDRQQPAAPALVQPQPAAIAEASPPPPPVARSMPVIAASPRDAESSVDGCAIDFAAEPATADEDLPPAEGGTR